MIIYRATNKINGKSYVGQTVKKLGKRIIEHRCVARRGDNRPFQNAIRKYGVQSFEWSVIDNADSTGILTEKEKYWINCLNTKTPNGYNLTDGGDGMLNVSPEIRAKLSLQKMGDLNPMKRPEVVEKMRKSKKGKSNGHEGQRHSEETKKKISEHRKGKTVGENHPMFGKNHSEESKKKISRTKKSNSPAWNKGLTKETDERVNKANKGSFYKGQIHPWSPWNKGKHHSDETKRKMSESHKRKGAVKI